MTLGFIVGKFYPPHRGHKHLIDSARMQVDELVVVVAHHPTQTIPGEVRLAWMQEIHPDCDVRLIPDELENESQPWADFTVRYLGRAPDVVFSSEDYGPVYASLMGSRHVMIDRSRTTVPISGTQVRDDPSEFLDQLEPCVRAWFVKRIVLIGAESTGKTTLAEQLASHYLTQWVPEYGREHWERKVAGHSTNAPFSGWTSEEFVHIAEEQQRREDAAARTANGILFCDTNAFATGTWHERYYQRRDERVDMIGSRSKADLYLIAAPDVPFVQDGFRDGEKIRDWMDQRFMEQLKQGSTPWQRIGGPFASRIQKAIAVVDRLTRKP